MLGGTAGGAETLHWAAVCKLSPAHSSENPPRATGRQLPGAQEGCVWLGPWQIKVTGSGTHYS